MCTAPQNIFVPADGILTSEGRLTFDEVVKELQTAVVGMAENPKMGPFTLGAIQNDLTKNRVIETLSNLGEKPVEANVVNPEFEDTRIMTPSVVPISEADKNIWNKECFGPIMFVVKVENASRALELAAYNAENKGAITCLCYSTDDNYCKEVEHAMNAVFTPVSFNFTGAAFVNQHAAFSDFHVTGGNPSGNATFTDALFINRRFVWVGNRYA
jgi:acyl-CoA reductase-like NAD-dependent aldehyde dehydrogenase